MDRSRNRLLAVITAVTLLGIGHHVDHAIRGNHVGWPLTGAVTPFTLSLLSYPFIIVGLVLWVRGRTVPGYWLGLTSVGFLFVSLVHFGPLAQERFADIVPLYESPAAGWFAYAGLIVFILSLLAAAGYSYALLRRE